MKPHLDVETLLQKPARQFFAAVSTEAVAKRCALLAQKLLPMETAMIKSGTRPISLVVKAA